MNNQGLEVETKILDTTESSLLPRLKELGFQLYFQGELKAQWLVNPDNGQKLRVRQEGEIVMIEHKSPIGKEDLGIKSLQETGFKAHDFEAAIETLCLVGLKKVGLPSVKYRVSHVLDYQDPKKKIRLDFDTYSDLMGKSIPEFLEIESTSAERVYSTVEALGFQKSDCRNFGPKELFKSYYPNETIL